GRSRAASARIPCADADAHGPHLGLGQSERFGCGRGRLSAQALRVCRALGARQSTAATVEPYRGKEIELTQKEYALLEYLMRNMGRTVSRQMISEHVWRQQVDPLTNVVDVYINYLRKKLEEDREHPLIHTVRGSGYVLRDDSAPGPTT